MKVATAKKKIKRVISVSRDQIIAGAIINKLSYEDTQTLLAKYKQPALYSRMRRDTIFIWAIFHNQGIGIVNELCEKYECEKLQ